jgi:hypothetical protein
MNNAAGDWIVYDDSIVRKIPGGWPELIENLVDGQVQPVMLIYERAQRPLMKS